MKLPKMECVFLRRMGSRMPSVILRSANIINIVRVANFDAIFFLEACHLINKGMLKRIA